MKQSSSHAHLEPSVSENGLLPNGNNTRLYHELKMNFDRLLCNFQLLLVIQVLQLVVSMSFFILGVIVVTKMIDSPFFTEDYIQEMLSGAIEDAIDSSMQPFENTIYNAIVSALNSFLT